MRKIEIFEPAMCCSTGVCGPSIDSELLRISTLINSLKQKGFIVSRFNLTSNTQEFVTNQIINDLLSKDGNSVLPITLVDGMVAKMREYPTNNEFSQWTGVSLDSKKTNKIKSSCCGESGCC